jgi:plasmid stability protein
VGIHLGCAESAGADQAAAIRRSTTAKFNTQRCDTLDCVKSRNVTFNLPEELLRAAKMYAAEHGTTVNSLVKGLLEQKLTAEGRSRVAVETLLAIAVRGPFFSVNPGSISREESHERW